MGLAPLISFPVPPKMPLGNGRRHSAHLQKKISRVSYFNISLPLNHIESRQLKNQQLSSVMESKSNFEVFPLYAPIIAPGWGGRATEGKFDIFRFSNVNFPLGHHYKSNSHPWGPQIVFLVDTNL